MLRIGCSLIILIGAVHVQAQIVAVDQWGAFLRVDEQTGRATLISQSSYDHLYSLALHENGWAYTVGRENIHGNRDQLIRLNPSTGAEEFVVELERRRFTSLAFSERGELFGTYVFGIGWRYLSRIDTSTGRVVSVGNRHYGLQGLDFSPGGHLYVSGSENLKGYISIVDPITGELTPVLTDIVGLLSIAFTPDGRLYGADNTDLYDINLATGDVNRIGLFGGEYIIRGIEWVPEPSALALLGLGLATMLRRR